jgi:ABC-type dipeptide/oligopeptide/nickel transport system ATPase subunit
VAGNIIFGDPVEDSFAEDRLHDNPAFLKFLQKEGLEESAWRLGAKVARETVDILGNLPMTPELFEDSPIAMEDFEEYREIVRELGDRDPRQLSGDKRGRLLKLALSFTPGIHKVVKLPETFQEKILEVRGRFKQWVEDGHSSAVAVSSQSEYIHSQNILNNILFGKLKHESGGAQERVAQSLIQLLIGEELLERIVEIGLTFEVGSMGDRLSGGQRQKVALARAFLKEPPILILDEATSALDNASQSRIQNLLRTRWKGRATIISVVHRLDTLDGYDHVAVMKSGQIIEFGTYQELLERKGVLYELVTGTKR